MIETIDTAQLSSFGIKDQQIKTWAYAHLQRNRPWFFVELHDIQHEISPRMLMLDSPQLLDQINNNPEVAIRIVYINTPPNINLTKYWKQEVLSSIWTAKDAITYSPLFVYELENGARYLDPYVRNHSDIKDQELVFKQSVIRELN